MQIENTSPFDAQITTTFDKTGREVVVLAVKGSFAFPDVSGEPALLSNAQEPLFLADVFGPDPETDATVFENDFAPFKPLCDVLCHGSATAPGSRPVTSLDVGLRVGNWSKALTVHGPRIWLKSAMGHRISDARPFVQQPISYNTAWGGVDYVEGDPDRASGIGENPVGVGYYPHRSDLDGAALPITAEYRSIVSETTGPYRPMAFGPLGRAWLPRRLYTGTFDQYWLDHRMPFPPDDMDPKGSQAAPADQQISFPKGGEPLELLNLTDKGRFGMTLPHDRVVVTFHRKHGAVTQKIANPDTLLVLCEERKICITWRTRFVARRDIHELDKIIVRRDQRGATA